MANKLSEKVRQEITRIAAEAGFSHVTRPDGRDRYVKNLMFEAPQRRYPIFIRQEGAGIGASGEPSYLQVAVHPDDYDRSLLAPGRGIEEPINRQLGQNLFLSSNYRGGGFPKLFEDREPCARCYQVENLDALRRLLLAWSSAPSGEFVHAVVAPSAASKEAKPEPVAPHTSEMFSRALVIKQPFIDEILAGRKTWEMRSENATHRGPLALIAKGTGRVLGVARLVDVLPRQTEAQMLANLDKHRISPERLRSGETSKWRVPWVLADAYRLPAPVRYRHPFGAVKWVKLSPEEAAAVASQVPPDWPRTI